MQLGDVWVALQLTGMDLTLEVDLIQSSHWPGGDVQRWHVPILH